MNISVIIVTYQSRDVIEACLSSLLDDSQGQADIHVVDNASRDGTAAYVKTRFPRVRLHENRMNLGFSAANNQALRLCDPNAAYVLFLNPDTTMRPNTLPKLMDFMDKHPQVGMAGPKIVNVDGSPQDSVSYRYPGHRFAHGHTDHLPGKIASVLGACMITRLALMTELGGFDEDFFLYGEDQDLCLRVRSRGFTIGYVEQVEVMHHGGKSEQGTGLAELTAKKIRAEYLFYQKHYSQEVIKRIFRYHYRRACWRTMMYRIPLPTTAYNHKRQKKLERYQAIRDALEKMALF